MLAATDWTWTAGHSRLRGLYEESQIWSIAANKPLPLEQDLPLHRVTPSYAGSATRRSPSWTGGFRHSRSRGPYKQSAEIVIAGAESLPLARVLLFLTWSF